MINTPAAKEISRLFTRLCIGFTSTLRELLSSAIVTWLIPILGKLLGALKLLVDLRQMLFVLTSTMIDLDDNLRL
jgi:hypothetical protein